MMIYLPIAGMPLNFFLLMGIGAAVGFLSGLFGIGGGFLLTPLLIFVGIPAPVAVASVTGQVVAASTSSILSYRRRGNVDFKLAGFLAVAGVAGAFFGVMTFSALQFIGQLNLVIGIGYVAFLSAIGTLMLVESARAIIRRRAGKPVRDRLPGQHNWVHGLPFKMRFYRSRLYVSVLPVIGIGLCIGFISSVLGIGGGFILIPALVYILRVPGNVVIGTALVQVLATMSASTVLHAVSGHNVDVILAFSLMVGGVIGAQFGASIGQGMRAEHLRGLLAVVILAVAVRFAGSLLATPADLFSIAMLQVGHAA